MALYACLITSCAKPEAGVGLVAPDVKIDTPLSGARLKADRPILVKGHVKSSSGGGSAVIVVSLSRDRAGKDSYGSRAVEADEVSGTFGLEFPAPGVKGKMYIRARTIQDPENVPIVSFSLTP